MGDPPKLRNKYSQPKRLWDPERLEEEKGLKTTYGLKNMREVWLASALLKKYRREARRLLSLTPEEREKNAGKILDRLRRMGVLRTAATPDDILSLTVKDILERRLQTIVLRKGLAHTMRQSRQLITHGYIQVNGRRVSIPSYLVFSEQEAHIAHTRKVQLRPPHAAPLEEKSEEPAVEAPAEPSAKE